MFSFIRKYYFIFCICYGIPFVLIFISIHIYYHYNQGARFVKERLPSSHVYTFEGIKFQEFNLKTPDSATISAGLFINPVQPSKGVIYFFHGNAGNIGKNLRYAVNFFSYGYDVMVIDWRGYGKSQGKSTEKAFYDDSQLVYEELKKLYTENQIYLMGHSFGCAMAANIASRNNSAGLILIGPLYSFEDAQQNCPWYIPKITEFPFRTDLFIQQTNSPVYIFSGTNDIVHEASVRLSKLLRSKDEYIEIKGYYWPSDKIKMDLVINQNPNLRIKILFEDDIVQW